MPDLVGPWIDRLAIAYMGVAMRDPNRVHFEDSVAKQAGFSSVIAHGTFAIGYAGAAVTRRFGADAIRQLSLSLRAPARPGDRLEVVLEALKGGSVGIEVHDQHGRCIARGTATVRTPG